MRWLDWLRRDHESTDDREPLDLQLIVDEGLRDRRAARQAVARLKHERKALRRRQRAISKQFERLTPVRVRNIARSGPAMGSYQLSQATRRTNTMSQDSERAKQVAEISKQIQEVDTALVRLKDVK